MLKNLNERGFAIIVLGLAFNIIETLYFGRNTPRGFNQQAESIPELFCDYLSLFLMIYGMYLMMRFFYVDRERREEKIPWDKDVESSNHALPKNTLKEKSLQSGVMPTTPLYSGYQPVGDPMQEMSTPPTGNGNVSDPPLKANLVGAEVVKLKGNICLENVLLVEDAEIILTKNQTNCIERKEERP